MLSKHKNSGYNLVIKIVNKASIEKTFTLLRESYAEIEVMKLVCRGQAPNMIKLLDYFEDSSYFYIITKYVPAGDLQDYVMKKWSRSPMPEKVVKHMLRQLVAGV